MIPSLFELIFVVIRFYIYALVINVIFSNLVSFGIIDTRNRLVWTLGDFLDRVTQPVLRPIRRLLPSFGGIDLSAVAVILLLQYVAVPALVTLERGIMFNAWSLL